MYYGLTLNTGEMSGNVYLNTFLSGAVEIPANFICVVLLNWEKTGRRFTTAGSGVLAGVSSLLCVPFIMSGQGWPATMLAMVGKGFVTISYNAIYVFSAEIFPTEVRNAAMGMASGCARLSTMAAPFVGAPMTRISKPLPYIIFGVLSTVAGVLALFLPETLNAKLCDTVEEAETFNG
ncbi:hypothetical protein NP493_695g00002 [Ridgeia piscesae]|uniref:Major facilitator superfamily (MFS) profile domain-containing protein n=1 Tax=Ridgeia piscesae TaxID=27915 RepID=A0AAD9KQZ8_RIDPI|nr:hypothetical protein NP493_695g00002 [Ridgeia piscesae]